MQGQVGETKRARPPVQGRGDPFGETTDPEIYIPRPASEAVLCGAAQGLERGATAAAILGPPGIGKTLLLLRAARLVSASTPAPPAVPLAWVALPYAAVGFDDWCGWVLGLLGEPPGADPEHQLRRWLDARPGPGPRLVVATDEAGAMPLGTARRLAEWTASECGLRLLLAATEDARASRVLSVLGERARTLRLTAAMTADETRAYVVGRLEAAAAPPDVRDRFDARALAWIHAVSGGIPRRVHEIARSLVESPPADVDRSWWEERWLGAPLDAASEAGPLDGMEEAGPLDLDLDTRDPLAEEHPGSA